MTWNENLYRYWKAHGGDLFALLEQTWDGTLMLEGSKGLLLIRTEAVGPSRYELDYYITVTAQVTLERPYALHIRPASLMWTGVHQVLGGVMDLGKSTTLYQDPRAPKSLKKRHITTSEPPFTKWVLQSAPLVELLAQRKDWAVRIGASAADERLHAVTAYAKTDAFFLAPEVFSMDSSGEGPADDPELSERQTPSFDETLTQLIRLAEEAAAAVTAWPMPILPPGE